MTSPASVLVPYTAQARTEGDRAGSWAALIGADYSARSITPQQSWKAPDVVRAALARFASFDSAHELQLAGRLLDLGDAGAGRRGEDWEAAREDIEVLAGRALQVAPHVIALGGDHSVTWPLVAAAARAHDGSIGLVQIDVHHDVRPLDDGPSNGTPVRGLIESGVLRGEDVVQVGIHPFANAEPLARYCAEQGITRLTLADIRERGAAAVAHEALRVLGDGRDALYLTVDIDVLDRSCAPGTVAALPGGLRPEELATIVNTICASGMVRMVDVVEFDPERDRASITAYNVAQVVLCALSALVRSHAT